ncbi:hypothetical protein CEXT_408581 [Caerostris extrusa]|uniref:Uncharacterized protein n=1 Tax=Caerostris extrusa TaxID=172846 RepID=A0AAV4MIC3_CAEEX|nr:hypothetical protein CEXT_408581 [Caerostris extrusa]
MRNSLLNGVGAFHESGETLRAGRLEIPRRDRAGRKIPESSAKKAFSIEAEGKKRRSGAFSWGEWKLPNQQLFRIFISASAELENSSSAAAEMKSPLFRFPSGHEFDSPSLFCPLFSENKGNHSENGFVIAMKKGEKTLRSFLRNRRFKAFEICNEMGICAAAYRDGTCQRCVGNNEVFINL